MNLVQVAIILPWFLFPILQKSLYIFYTIFRQGEVQAKSHTSATGKALQTGMIEYLIFCCSSYDLVDNNQKENFYSLIYKPMQNACENKKKKKKISQQFYELYIANVEDDVI